MINRAMIEDGDGNAIIFDAAISETHVAAVDITKYPVESGFNISDHVIRRNRKIVLDIITSNQTVQGLSETGNRVQEQFNRLHEFNVQGTLVELTTNLDIYYPCVIVSIQTKQDKDTITVLRSQVILEQLYVEGVRTTTGFEPKEIEEVEDVIQTASALGLQPPTPDAVIVKLYKLPVPSFTSGVTFDYKGSTMQMSTPTYSEIGGVGKFKTNLGWDGERGILKGLPIASGVGILQTEQSIKDAIINSGPDLGFIGNQLKKVVLRQATDHLANKAHRKVDAEVSRAQSRAGSRIDSLKAKTPNLIKQFAKCPLPTMYVVNKVKTTVKHKGMSDMIDVYVGEWK